MLYYVLLFSYILSGSHFIFIFFENKLVKLNYFVFIAELSCSYHVNVGFLDRSSSKLLALILRIELL